MYSDGEALLILFHHYLYKACITYYTIFNISVLKCCQKPQLFKPSDIRGDQTLFVCLKLSVLQLQQQNIIEPGCQRKKKKRKKVFVFEILLPRSFY